MKTTIQKWGNSLTIKSGKLVIVPSEPAITLESLVQQITDENRHDEVGTGERVGSEA